MISFLLSDLNIFIGQNVLDVIASFRQLKKEQNESGGILLGQVKENNIYILRNSIPTPFDSATRTSFVRNKKIAQIIIDYEFANSQNKTVYLGEWHTHPEDYPTPSFVDKEMISDQFKFNKLNEPWVLLLIQGRKGFYIGKYDGKKLIGKQIT